MFEKINRFIIIFAFVIQSVYASQEFINLDELYPDLQERQQFIEAELHSDPVLRSGLRRVVKVARNVLEKHNIDYWINFGTFLGAVRHEDIIPWDDDIDLGFNQTDEEKLYTLKEEFLELGYNLFPDRGQNIVGYKLYSTTPIKLINGKEIYPFLDLFLYHLEEERYILSREKGRQIFPNSWFRKEQIENKKRYKLNDIEIWGPDDPDSWFTQNYGPEWHTKALHHKKHHETSLKKYVWTLAPHQSYEPPKVESAKDNEVYWNGFYKHIFLEREPSSFCEFVLQNEHVKSGETLVDIGCGNGRDTFGFLTHGLKAVGVDSSRSAIEANISFAEKFEGLRSDFRIVNVNQFDKLVDFKDYDAIYARFFLHSITEADQAVFFKFLTELKQGAAVLLEFRTDKDPMFKRSGKKISATEGITDHYRRYVNFDQFCQDLINLNFELAFAEEKDGLSVRGDDNPFLARIVARKKIAVYSPDSDSIVNSLYGNSYGSAYGSQPSQFVEETSEPSLNHDVRRSAVLKDEGYLSFPGQLNDFDFQPRLFNCSQNPAMRFFNPDPHKKTEQNFPHYPNFPKEFDGHLHYIVQVACLGEGISNGLDLFEQRKRFYVKNYSQKHFFSDRDLVEKTPYKIPQIFHTIWLTSPTNPVEVPKQYITWAEEAEKSNPCSEGWQHLLWIKNKKLLPDTVKYLSSKNSPLKIQEYDDLNLPYKISEILSQYISERKLGKASDLLRYLLVEQMGGIYKDTDYLIARSCIVLNKVYDFYAGIEPMSTFIGNAFIAAKAHHPVLQHVIKMILRNHTDAAPPYIKKISKQDAFRTVLETGPNVLSVAFYEAAGQSSNIDIIFPPMMLYPTPNPSYPQKVVIKPGENIPEDSLGAHYWNTSWYNKKYGSEG